MGLLRGASRMQRALGEGGMRRLESGAMFGRPHVAPFQRMDDAALDAAGYRATPRYGSEEAAAGFGPRANPTTELAELGAMRRKLRELKQERAFARTPEELQEIDMEISWLMRDMGM